MRSKNLGEILRRIQEGAAMIRTKGEPGTGDIVQAVQHMRSINQEIAKLQAIRKDELYHYAKELQVSYELALYVHEHGALPVQLFGWWGSNSCRCCLMVHLGAEGVFVGSWYI